MSIDKSKIIEMEKVNNEFKPLSRAEERRRYLVNKIIEVLKISGNIAGKFAAHPLGISILGYFAAQALDENHLALLDPTTAGQLKATLLVAIGASAIVQPIAAVAGSIISTKS